MTNGAEIPEYEVTTSDHNLTATTFGSPFTNLTAPRFYGVELAVRS